MEAKIGPGRGGGGVKTSLGAYPGWYCSNRKGPFTRTDEPVALGSLN